jgi:hypothetical protein
MNSTPDGKATETTDSPVALADERLAHAHEQIKRADEQLARLTEQLAKMERDTAPVPSAGPVQPEPPQQEPVQPAPVQQVLDQHEPGSPGPGSHGSGPQVAAGPIPGPQPPQGNRALWTRVGLPLAACIIAAILFLQSSYGDGAKLVVARWAPQLVSAPSSPPENPPSTAQPAPATFQVAAAESVPAQAPPPPQVPTLAQAAPQDAAPAAPAAAPDQTQLLQTIARDLANLERNIEQLRTNQQQMANDNAKAIADLKANQDEMKRALARTSDQAPARGTPPPAQPAPALRKPERPRPQPQARARPRYPYPQEWIYDDW